MPRLGADAVSTNEGGDFQLRRVFAVAWTALRGRWAPMLAFSLLLAFAPAEAPQLFHRLGGENSITIDISPAPVQSDKKVAAKETSAGHLSPAEAFIDFGPVEWAWLALSQLCGVARTAALTSLTLSSVAGGRTPWRTAGRDLLVNLAPLTLIALVSTVLVLFGSLVIVPGLMLFTAWAVAGPTRVAERLGVLGSLVRSAQLTRGFRWLILGLAFIWLAGLIVSNSLATEALAAFGAPAAASEFVSPVAATLASLAYDVIAAAFYLELRRVKDGVAYGAAEEAFA
jgi:hypothetical protein